MPLKPGYLLLAGGGAIFVWSGLRGKSVTGVFRGLIGGEAPAKAPSAGLDIGGVNPATGTGGSSDATAGTPMQNYLTVGRFLMANGYTKSAAAGICGCIAGESGGDPESQGSGGNGLIGWTPPLAGARTGNPSRDLQFQMQAILTYNNSIGQFSVANLNQQPDPVSAARYYSKYFEKPLIPYSDVRPDVALAVYAALLCHSSPVTCCSPLAGEYSYGLAFETNP